YELAQWPLGWVVMVTSPTSRSAPLGRSASPARTNSVHTPMGGRTMTIDPRWGMWISIIAAILSFLVGAGATFTDLFGPEASKTIVGVAVLLNGVTQSTPYYTLCQASPVHSTSSRSHPPISKTLLPTTPEGNPLRRYSPQANWEFDPVHVGV